MKVRALVLLTALCLLLAPLAHAAGKLISGPMLGYSAHREAFVWVETKDAKNVTLEYWLAGQPETARKITKSRLRDTPAGGQISHFRPGLLEMGATYEYSVSIDGVKQAFAYPLAFKTHALWEWRAPPPDFKFIFGTCAYLNEEKYDRPGAPYGTTMETFAHMADSGADFMVWGGDNWYYRDADFDSVSGLWYRAQHDRATPELQKLFAVMPHYATWDDHDFGPNDSNKSFEFKDESLDIFKAYWGNPGYGEAGHPGVYHKFFWGDAAFFVMDNRWNRDDDQLAPAAAAGLKSQYGEHQREWLKQSLLHAQMLPSADGQTAKRYAFKFIVTGGQVITDFGGASETFAYYTAEREDLVKFIKDHGITGVIFLSGDVHFTELARKKLTDTQWIYELTSSSITSGTTNLARERAPDPHRVDGTFLDDRNFCLLALHGAPEARVVTITCVDKQGAVRWAHDIAASELK